eukprot:gene11679-24459_t
MNPVLASSFEFESYLNSRKIDTKSYGNHKNGQYPQSKDQSKQKAQMPKTLKSSTKPVNTSDMNGFQIIASKIPLATRQDFDDEVHTQNEIRNTPQPRKASLPQPESKTEIQHSWRAHLSNNSNIQKSSAGSSIIMPIIKKEVIYGSDEEIPNHASKLQLLSHYHTDQSKSKPIPIPISNSTNTVTDSSNSTNQMKKLIKKYFYLWTNETEENRCLSHEKYLKIRNRHSKFTLFLSWKAWILTQKLSTLLELSYRRLMFKCLRNWHKCFNDNDEGNDNDDTSSSLIIAASHHDIVLLKLGMKRWYRVRVYSIGRKLQIHSSHCILKKVMWTWRLAFRRRLSERNVEVEARGKRLQGIAKLVQSIEQRKHGHVQSSSSSNNNNNNNTNNSADNSKSSHRMGTVGGHSKSEKKPSSSSSISSSSHRDRNSNGDREDSKASSAPSLYHSHHHRDQDQVTRDSRHGVPEAWKEVRRDEDLDHSGDSGSSTASTADGEDYDNNNDYDKELIVDAMAGSVSPSSPPPPYDRDCDSQRLNTARSTTTTNSSSSSSCNSRSPRGSIYGARKAASSSSSSSVSTPAAIVLSGSSFDARARERRDKLSEMRRQGLERAHKKTIDLEEEKRRRQQTQDEAQLLEAQKHKMETIQYKQRTEHLLKKKQADKDMQSKMMEKMTQKAHDHYRKQLLVVYGIGPWLRLVNERRLDWEKAVTYHRDYLIQSTWDSLSAYVIARKTERYRMEQRQSHLALAHYRSKLLRLVWNRFHLWKRLLRAKAAAVFGQATMFRPVQKAFSAWKISLERQYRHIAKEMKRMKPLGDRCIMRHVWRQWYQHTVEQRTQREISLRSNMMWSKVQ